ncbi:MAG: archaemetzincin [Pseudomonadota bacterium]|nr:archaemetzincin [Pseudomonadota bacterium]
MLVIKWKRSDCLSFQSEHSILISPVEDFNPDLLESISREVQRLFGYRTEIMSLLQDVGFALDPGRDQHHSTLILEKLAGLAPARVIKVLAVTRVDLFIPILTHVYGEAQIGGRACILSTHRLNEGLATSAREIFNQRVVKETIHELGHTFNLRHCQEHACIMHYCRSIKDVDRKADQLCRYCRILLADELKRLAAT